MTVFRICLLRFRPRFIQIQRRLISGQSALVLGDGGTEFLDEHELKRRLLDASLKYVPSTGWTVEAVTLGANELKLPDVMHGLFNDAGASLVSHFIQSKNKELIEYMKEERARLNQQPRISFSNFVSNAVKHRLQLNIPFIERLPEALAIAQRPDQLPQCTKSLLQMSDDICFHGGDRSTDLSWYTKRTSVASLYAATELYMIQDESAHFEDTWLFLNRRLDDLKYVGQTTRQASSMASTILDLAYTFYIVGRNTMGANTESQSYRRQS